MILRAGRVLMAIGLLSATAIGASAGSAGAEPTTGACTDATGVTVVVDFQQHLGGQVVVGCAEQPVSSGFDALKRAGFDVTSSQHSPGFVCRIDGLPAPSEDHCILDSPITAYWSYWYALPGGVWTYSSSGAANRSPAPGSVEGWSFSFSPSGGTAPSPRIAPPVPASPPISAASTSPPTDPAPAAAPTTAPPSSTSHREVPSSTAATPTALTPSVSTTTSIPLAAVSSSTTSTTSAPPVRVESADAFRARSASSDSSSPWTAVGSIVALFAIVAAGTGAGIVSRRRARAE